MQFLTLENYLTNINFFLLFLTMIFYLLQSSYFISAKWSFLPNYSILLSSFLQASFLCLRWITSGHFPLSNLYESLLFLSWVLTSVLVFLNIKIRKSGLKQKNFDLEIKVFKTSQIQTTDRKKTSTVTNLIDSFLGSILTPLILLINTFANFSLPSELKLTTSLVPALKSNWLMMHVTLMMLSYGALLCGCLLAIAFLIVQFFSPEKTDSFDDNQNSFTGNSLLDKSNPLKATFPKSERLPLANNLNNRWTPSFNENTTLLTQNEKTFFNKKTLNPNLSNELTEILDNLSYRVLGFGFPLLTIGILSGAVWANQTWGSYWSWDPKETWALITWLVFAIYLHTRISHGWSGQQSALIASFGFIIIWICYLGVNLLGKGLHSYGFFS